MALERLDEGTRFQLASISQGKEKLKMREDPLELLNKLGRKTEVYRWFGGLS